MILFIQLFLMIFIVILFLYEFLLFRDYKPKKKKNNQYPTEIKILIHFFKLDIRKLSYSRLLHVVSVVSSFDIALIVSIAGIFKSGILQILVALVLVIPVIFFSYYLVAFYYKNRSKRRKER